MKTTILKVGRKPRVKDAVLIEGLPGMGYVGKLAAEHLVTELHGRKFAEIYSPHFPHHVSIDTDGILRPLRNELYHSCADGKDLIFWIGDVQPLSPEGHYEMVERVLDLAWTLKVREIFTLGGYATGRYIPKRPRVIGFGSQDLVRRAGDFGAVTETGGGPIIGAAGLLIGLGRLRGMKGACLLGETHGMVVDHRAAKAVLDVLMGMLEIKIDMSNLEERAKRTEKLMEKLGEEMKRRRQEERELREEEISYIA
jgi:hypothetical protein